MRVKISHYSVHKHETYIHYMDFEAIPRRDDYIAIPEYGVVKVENVTWRNTPDIVTVCTSGV